MAYNEKPPSKFKGLSQLDYGGVLKNAHSIGAEALKTIDVDNIVGSYYNRISIDYDGNGSATGGTAYYDYKAEETSIKFVADVSGSLNGTYWLLNSANNETSYYIWYNVGGTGIDPNVLGKVGIQIPIQFNDTAAIIQLATKLIIGSYDDFIVKGAADTLYIKNSKPGETTSSIDISTGFNISVKEEGATDLVNTFSLDPVADAKYLYNEYEKTFELYNFVEFHSDFVETTYTGEKALRVQGEISVTIDPNNNNEITYSYNEVSGVVKSTLTTINTFIAPIGKTTFLQRVSAGGSNIAVYEVQINGLTVEKRRTYFGAAFTTDFEFIGSAESGLELTVGDVVTVKVIHERPNAGDFEAKIQILQVG